MNNKQLVSIIVPVYNAEKYLSGSIESVLNQTYTNFELLLINDRSTDKSKEICEEYSKKDERIILLENDTENHGPGPTRNIGLDNAMGDFIYFMDADDWIDKSLLEICIDRMNETNADIVQVGFEYVRNGGKEVEEQYCKGKCVVTREDIKNDFFSFWRENRVYLWIQFLRRETVKGLKFENIINSEDICYILDAFCNAEKIAYVPKAMYHYRHIEGSTCHRWVEDIITCLCKQWEHQMKFLKSLDGEISKEEYSYVLYDIYMWAVYQLSSSFCPLSFKDKKRELLKFEKETEFNKYRRIYPLKFRHGIDKIYCILTKCHLEWIILMFRAVLLKLLKGE